MGPNTGAQVPHGRDQTDRKQQGNGAPPFKVRPGRLPAPGTNKRPDPNRRARHGRADTPSSSMRALAVAARELGYRGNSIRPSGQRRSQRRTAAASWPVSCVWLGVHQNEQDGREYWQCSCLVWINKFPPSTYGLEGGNELNFHLNPSRQVWIGED